MRFFQRLGLSEINSYEKGVINSFALLFFMFVVLRADHMVMAPLISAIQVDFNIGIKEIGFTGSAFTIIAAVVALLWGYLSDKYSRKWLLIGSVLVGEVPCFLTAFARNYEEFFILRVLTGIGIGGLVPVAFSMLSDLFTEKQRSRAQAWYMAMGALGTLLGMVAAGFIGPALGWRIPFIIVSAPNFFFVLAMALGGKEPRRGGGEQAVKDLVLSGKKYARTLGPRDYLKMFKVPSNIWLLVQSIPGTVAWGIIPFFLVKFFETEKNYSIELATILLLIMGIGVIIGNICGGIAGSRFYLKNKRYLPVYCGMLQLAGLIPIMAALRLETPADPVLTDVILPALLGFCGAILVATAGPNVQAMLANVNLPEHRGRIASVFCLTDAIGQGFGPVIGGLLAASYSLDFTMQVSALFWIPCGIGFFILAMTLPKDVEKVNQTMEEIRQEMVQKTDSVTV